MDVAAALAWALAAYFIGGVPTAYLLGKLTRGVDIRTVGTRNVGAANVTREVGRWQGAAVLAMDAGKGTLCVVVADALPGPGWRVPAAGIAALAGHNFSPYLRFYGGKGVATAFGVALGLWPVMAAVYALCPAALTIAVTRNPVAAFAVGAAVFGVALAVSGAGGWDIALWVAVVAVVTGTAYGRTRKEWHAAIRGFVRRANRRRRS